MCMMAIFELALTTYYHLCYFNVSFDCFDNLMLYAVRGATQIEICYNGYDKFDLAKEFIITAKHFCLNRKKATLLN